MMRELETLVLLHDVPEHDLKSGDVGAVVHRNGDANALGVEFVTKALVVLTLSETHVRPIPQ